MTGSAELDDFSDLENRLVLAVTANRVNALLSFIADARNLVGLLVSVDDIGRNAHLGNGWRSDLNTVAINDKQWFKTDACAFGFDEFNLDGFTFGD